MTEEVQMTNGHIEEQVADSRTEQVIARLEEDVRELLGELEAEREKTADLQRQLQATKDNELDARRTLHPYLTQTIAQLAEALQRPGG